jgi:hypothetical protein
MAGFWFGIAISAKPIWLLDSFQTLACPIKFKPSSTYPEPTMTHDAFDAMPPPYLHDLAKAEAERLRRQAMHDFGHEVVDDFWRGADVVYRHCLQASHTLAERGAARLQARLARRALDRLAPSPTSTTGI